MVGKAEGGGFLAEARRHSMPSRRKSAVADKMKLNKVLEAAQQHATEAATAAPSAHASTSTSARPSRAAIAAENLRVEIEAQYIANGELRAQNDQLKADLAAAESDREKLSTSLQVNKSALEQAGVDAERAEEAFG